MNRKISPDDINALSATLLIPLWAKAVEYPRPDALLRDAEAVRMMVQIDYDFSSFATAKLSQPGCCARAALIDEETREFIRRHPDAVVVQLGAGLDACFERLGGPPVSAWYDLDLPDVIALRRRLLPESGNHYLEASLFEPGWMEQVARHGKPVLLLLEGVLMYFDEAEVKRWFRLLAEKLPGAMIVFDMLPVMGLNRAKQHDALRRMENRRNSNGHWKISKTWRAGSRVCTPLCAII